MASYFREGRDTRKYLENNNCHCPSTLNIHRLETIINALPMISPAHTHGGIRKKGNNLFKAVKVLSWRSQHHPGGPPRRRETRKYGRSSLRMTEVAVERDCVAAGACTWPTPIAAHPRQWFNDTRRKELYTGGRWGEKYEKCSFSPASESGR